MPTPRDPNIFYKLVTDEVSTTELLSNLMRFEDFRRLLLSILLTQRCASQVRFEDISTRARLDEGEPDVVIDNSEIYAFIEVKVVPWCRLTLRQRDLSYLKALSKEHRKEGRWLVFLVPDNWKYTGELQTLLGGLDTVHPESGVHARIKF